MQKPVLVSAAIAALLTGASGASALSITLTPSSNHPGASVGLTGSGFGADEAVDIYFDATDELLVLTDDGGNFAKHGFEISADALPGQHWVSAVERDNGKGMQKVFTVTTPWAEFGFNTRSRRYNPYENVISPQNVAQLDQAWVATLGGAVSSSPAVVNGTVYVGSFDKKLYAYDAASGAKLWSTATGGAIESSPAVLNQFVYVGSDDGKLWAVNAATGAVVWSTATGGGSVSSPSAANGIVYAGTSGGQFVALLASTGVLKWSANIGASITSTPAIFSGAVFFGASNGNFYAYNAASGVSFRSQTLGGAVYDSPALANGIVYIGAQDGLLYGYTALSGRIAFSVNWGDGGGCPISGSPSVANSKIYYFAADGDHCDDVYAAAFSSRNGQLLYNTSAGDGWFRSSPAVANGVLYFVAPDTGKLLAFDAASGAPLWDGVAGDGSDITSSPAISDGMVFVGSNGGSKYLTAFALNGGDNPLYKQRRTLPPSFAKLHPDFHLKPVR